MTETLDLSLFVRTRCRRHLAHGPRGRRRRLRRLHPQDRERAEGAAGRDAKRGSTSPTAGWRSTGATTTLDAAEVIAALERIGYRAHPFEPARAESEEARQARWLMRCLAVAGFAAMNIMLLSVSVWSGSGDMTPETRDFFHWLSALIALPAAAYAGQPFFRSAWRRCEARQDQHGRADLARRDARARHVAWSRPSTTPITPISIPRSCCCSSCCAAAISTTRCGARRARSPAISPR